MKYFLDQSVCVGGSKICIISRAQSTKKKKRKKPPIKFLLAIDCRSTLPKTPWRKAIKKTKTKKTCAGKTHYTLVWRS